MTMKSTKTNSYRSTKWYPQTKKLQDILHQIIHQVGPNNLEDFKKFAKQFQKQASGAAAGIDAAAGAVAAQEDEDEVPELVAGETFKATTKEGHTF
ncbi:hypothetical protein T459_21427 [Capsicum annuum]|uniref:Uncharacterized protein n=1 Tax=Capsicum annuum TaxID=4072 RepID=A0A2G2YWK3_CAPAN|nr:hypothetical protein T459_21427 [Capsicum annuum]